MPPRRIWFKSMSFQARYSSLISMMGMFLCGFVTFYLFQSMFTDHSNQFFIGHAHSYEEIENIEGPSDPVEIHSESEIYHKGEAIEAEKLSNKVRILCMILTKPSNHDKKAKHVKATWARRCTKLIFMSSEENKALGAINLNMTEGRDYLWQKTKISFTYVYKNYLTEYDWFLKADDDTYIIMENLRYMLNSYRPQDPAYYGCRFNKFAKQGYMSGGAGYILSKEAVKKFVLEGIPNSKFCNPGHGGAEDAELGKCLEKIGVKAIDTRDNLGRGRFFPFVPEHHLIPSHIGKGNWYWDYIYYNTKEGMDCCSDTAISFHYVTPDKMYEMEYLIYHLRPYGIHFQAPYPMPLPPDKIGIPQEVIDSFKYQKHTSNTSQTNNTIVQE